MKMKISTLLLISLFGLVSCESTTGFESDLEKNNLNGKVKSITAQTFKVDEKFGEIIKVEKYEYEADIVEVYNEHGIKVFQGGGEFWGDFNENIMAAEFPDNLSVKSEEDLVKIQLDYKIDSLDLKMWLKHSKNGLLLKKYISKGNLSKWDFIEILEYDDYGNLLSETYEKEGKPDEIYKYDCTYDSKGRLLTKKDDYDDFSFKYDTKGRMIEKTELDYLNDKLYSKEVSKYDEFGNLVEFLDYNSKGDLSKKENYKYNKYGNIIEALSYNSNSLKSKIENSYNEKQQVIQRKILNNSGYSDKELLLEFKYDEYGNLIEQITFKGTGKFKQRDTYEYKYDSKGNWISKLHRFFYSENLTEGMPYTITERNITYYN